MKATGPLRRTAGRVLSLARWVVKKIPLSHGTRVAARRAVLRLFDDAGDPAIASDVRGAVFSGGRAVGYVEAPAQPLSPFVPSVRAVAFYLPQFHPTPQNDAWWGKGFTEWSNVARAKPQFPGHAQPRIPADLGFYDLRVDQVMHEQIELARSCGIAAFCFYFYWFNGTRLLDAPVERFRNDSSLDFPYCLCWANEPWSRRWDGREHDLLMPQHHSAEDDIAFIAEIARHMRDARYLRVGSMPVLLVYRTGLMPDARATAHRWREYCRAEGIGEIHLVCVQSFEEADPVAQGFDASVQFPPNLSDAAQASSPVQPYDPEYRGEILDWQKMAAQFVDRALPTPTSYRGVNPAWDNEPRRPAAGRSFVGASPRRYERWLRWAARDTAERIADPDRRLVFVNAWNEWAEGAYLEPDTRLGHAWLAATRRALGDEPAPDPRFCVVAHAYYPEFVDELLDRLAALGRSHRLVITTTAGVVEDVRRRLRSRDAQAEVLVNENRGRDVLPFLKACDRLLDEGVDIVLKVHGKKSPHLRDGQSWRGELLDDLMEPKRAGNILDAFASRPELGLVGPAGHWIATERHIGANSEGMDRLAKRLGMPGASIAGSGFFAGTMFWVRLDALRSLLDATLDEAEFEAESGVLDATIAHACERLFGTVVDANGFRIALSDAPSSTDLPMPADEYHYLPRVQD